MEVRHVAPLVCLEMMVAELPDCTGVCMAQTFETSEPVNFSIVSQRRVFPPGGLKGGEDGARGANTLFRRMGDGVYCPVNVGSDGIAAIARGDRVQIATPGAGGWGKPV